MNLSREVNYNASMNHPCVLKFIGYSPFDFNNEPKPVIITEFSKNGSLSEILELERCSRSIPGWDDTKKLIMIYGIASGMMYLHSNEILHRDLKPQNILTDDRLFPKIGDFGLSKKKHYQPESATFESKIEIKGTPIYIAPEVFETEQYSKEGDVYAFALIVYEIMTLEIPFSKLNFLQIYKEVSINGNRPRFDHSIDESYRKLIEKCWSQDPNNRPTFAEIVEELENDEGFITDSVDKVDFLDYVEFIKEYPSSFRNRDVVKFENCIRNPQSKTFQKVDISEYSKEDNDKSFFSKFRRLFKKKQLYPIDEFKNLNEHCKELVVEAENDPTKQFFIGQNLFEGINDFPKNIGLGIKYLEQSIIGGNLQSVIYYCQKLIKGNQIQQDLQKAKKYLQKYLKTNDCNILTLYGKILFKEENYVESIKYFEKLANESNLYCMYKYGRMLICGSGIQMNVEKGMNYLNLSKDNGCHKSDLYLHILNLVNNDETYLSLSVKMKDFFIMQIIKYNINQHCADEEISIANKEKIIMKYKDTHKFFYDNSIDFNYALLSFNDISIELLFPSEIFKRVFTNVLMLKKKSKRQINIRILISGIKSISNQFEHNAFINEIIIFPSVKSIISKAFNGCTSLTRIEIPPSVTIIPNGIFNKCCSLKSISIPSSVTSVEGFAFSQCSSLSQISISQSVKSIGESAFSQCSSLTQISIPSFVKSIGNGAFYGCSSLKHFSIPPSVTLIEKFAFNRCSSLISIQIPPSVTLIEEFAFNRCSSLISIQIPSSVTSIGHAAFFFCSSLILIEIPPSVSHIEEEAFYGCTSLKQISIPSSITHIKKSVFGRCSSLEQISIPSSVTSIGDLTFDKCTSLKQISIPSSFTSIGDISIPSNVHVIRT